MNDFLQTLRSNPADKQRTPMTRKNYDAAFNSSMPRYQYVNRAAPSFHNPNHFSGQTMAPSSLETAIESLNIVIQSLAENQTRLIDAQEKTADMLERQTIGLERILDHLNISS